MLAGAGAAPAAARNAAPDAGHAALCPGPVLVRIVDPALIPLALRAGAGRAEDRDGVAALVAGPVLVAVADARLVALALRARAGAG